MPYPCSPMRASPESLSSMRLYRGCMLFQLSRHFVGKIFFLLFDAFAQLIPHEAADRGVPALFQEILDLELAVRVLDVDLLDEAAFAVELLHLAVDDLGDHVGRFSGFLGLRLVNRALP